MEKERYMQNMQMQLRAKCNIGLIAFATRTKLIIICISMVNTNFKMFHLDHTLVKISTIPIHKQQNI